MRTVKIRTSSKEDLEEDLKKIKTRIKRTKITKTSLADQDIMSKIKDLTVLPFEGENGQIFLDIHVTKVEVLNKDYNVDFRLICRPIYDTLEIFNNKYLPNKYYKNTYLQRINSYDLWIRHYRECFWSIAKGLQNVTMD